MSKTIVVVDDERDIVELVSINLKKAGFSVKEFGDAAGFMRSLKSRQPDLVILDLMLPDMDGFEICKHLKKDDRTARIPVIMLTAKGDETDKIIGLELGADDYVTKPFSPRELVARVKVVLRRNETKGDSRTIAVGDLLTVDTEKFETLVAGQKVELTTTEFKILELLASKKGWVFSREKILDHLWGEDKAVIDRTVDVHIRNLREKLGSAAQYIKNIRGMGYKLED
jgi:two-component system phosphate regulon response regulator PhoB/two-component system alkaline phosphatase synthesis response regulator PhoP